MPNPMDEWGQEATEALPRCFYCYPGNDGQVTLATGWQVDHREELRPPTEPWCRTVCESHGRGLEKDGGIYLERSEYCAFRPRPLGNFFGNAARPQNRSSEAPSQDSGES